MSIGQYTRVVGPIELSITTTETGLTSGVSVVNGGSGFIVGDILDATDFAVSSGTLPTGIQLVVQSVTGSNGEIATLGIQAAGTDGTTGTTLTATGPSGTELGFVDSATYVEHAYYESGGVVAEYPYGIDGVTGSNYPPNPSGSAITKADNLPTIKTVRTADNPQLQVQKRTVTSGGVTVTVYAEPTIVDAAGNVLGNTLRAEDILDQSRCEGLGFIWDTTTKVTGTREAYGFCRPVLPTEISDAASNADCPVGYEWDNTTGCQAMTTGTINAITGITGATGRIANCEAVGFLYNYATDTCFDPSVTGNIGMFTITGVPNLFPTTGSTKFAMGVVEYAKNQCRLYGYVWNKATNTCEVDNSANLTGRADCVNAGYVWIAGACYNPNEFGDGMSRLPASGTASKSTQLETPV